MIQRLFIWIRNCLVLPLEFGRLWLAFWKVDNSRTSLDRHALLNQILQILPVAFTGLACVNLRGLIWHNDSCKDGAEHQITFHMFEFVNHRSDNILHTWQAEGETSSGHCRVTKSSWFKNFTEITWKLEFCARETVNVHALPLATGFSF